MRTFFFVCLMMGMGPLGWAQDYPPAPYYDAGYQADTPAYLQGKALQASSLLATKRGVEASVAYGHYSYNEPNVQIAVRANPVTASLGYTWLMDDGRSYLKAEAEGFRVDGTYHGATWGGSLVRASRSDTKVDVRGLMGRDFAPAYDVVLSPYLGIGGRYLDDNNGNYQTLGAYQRQNLMAYAVLGLDTRWDMFGVPFEFSNEYDNFLWGKQRSYFTDLGASINVDNKQREAHAYRGKFALLSRFVDVGVYYEQWGMGDSELGYVDGLYVIEPKNITREYGVFLRHRF